MLRDYCAYVTYQWVFMLYTENKVINKVRECRPLFNTAQIEGHKVQNDSLPLLAGSQYLDTCCMWWNQILGRKLFVRSQMNKVIMIQVTGREGSHFPLYESMLAHR